MKIKNISSKKYEAVIFLALFMGFFGGLAHFMGTSNMLNTIMKTAWDLLLNTVFFIMGITVLTGAIGRLLIEFGVVRLLEKALAPLMRPLFNLPGVAALAGVLTFLSDNPAIISLSNDKDFSKYFKKRELLSLTNFGTSFGMGLIVITFMSALTDESGNSFFSSAMMGLVGAVIGAIISTRLMQRFIKGKVTEVPSFKGSRAETRKLMDLELESHEKKPVFLRFLDSLLDGGKEGVNLGLAIIPGVLIISTAVMILTFGPKDPTVGYQGLAYEGVPVLPKLASYVSWLFKGLFGFEHPELISFPVTSLGAVGAALSIVKTFVEQKIITGNEIAVFTAMGMCWSGFLSTHTAMLDTAGYRQLTSKALLAHTIGGIAAGCAAHYIYVLFSLF